MNGVIKMKLCIDADGIIFCLEIKDMPKDSDWWCDTCFSVVSEPWLRYERQHDCIFRPCELEDISSKLNRLLNGEMTIAEQFRCAEPDITFVMYPKCMYDLPESSGCRQRYESSGIQTDIQISFWCGGLTNNYLSLTLDGMQTEHLKNYIDLVCGKIQPEDEIIRSMIEAGILKD